MSVWKKAFALTLLTALPIAGYSCAGSWAQTTSPSNWSDAVTPVNWNPNGCSPNPPGSVSTNTDMAVFPSVAAAAVSVAIDTGTPPILHGPGLASLIFNSPSTSYTITSASSNFTVNFNAPSSDLRVIAGRHTINAILVSPLNGVLNISVTDPAGSLTITQGLTRLGTSNLTFSGPGQLIMQNGPTATQSYFANDFTVNSGTVLAINSFPRVATDGPVISLVSGTITGSGIVNLQNANSVNNGAFGVIMDVNGPLTISGNGIVNLQNANAVNSGGIGGVIDVIGQLTISSTGTLNIINTGAVGANSIGSEVSAGNLLMTGGSLNIINTGTTTGNGIGSRLLASTAAINGGVLINNDLVGINTLNIGPGGTVGGTGIFQNRIGLSTALILNSGTFIAGGSAPGSPYGITTVQGSYVQNPNGTLIINLGTPTSLPPLNISGTAELAGTLEVGLAAGSTIQSGSYKIISATGGVLGTFSNVRGFGGLTPTVQYFPNYVLVSLFGPGSLGTGDFYPNYAESLFASINHINLRLDRQMSQLRNRFTGPYVEFREIAAVAEKKELLADNSPGINPQVQEKQEQLEERFGECNYPWSIYFGPTGDFGRVLTKNQAVGFHYNSAGALAGFDYAYSDLGIGFLFDYEHFTGRVNDKWGRFNITQTHGSLYATYIRSAEKQLAFNLILGGGYEWYNIRRNTFMGVARGTPQGVEFDALAGMQYTFESSDCPCVPLNVQFVPLVNLQYIYLHVNHYREHGAGIFNQQFDSQNVRSLRSTLGFRLNRTWEWTNVVFKPELNVGWQWEFFDKNRNLHVDGSGFTTQILIPQAGRNVALGGLDFLVTFFDKYGVEASYDFQWNKLYVDHYFYLGCNFKF